MAGLTIPAGGGLEVREIYEMHVKNSSKFMLATEACNGYLVPILHTLTDKNSESNNRGVRPGDWHRGYRYTRDIFYQLGNGAAGWVDWNLLLDGSGGPNWAGNNVDSPVMVSSDNTSLWVNPSYFHLAHWAKYVPPGSTALTVASTASDGVMVAAFERPDGRVAVVVISDQLDGHGDPPPNQVLNVTVKTTSNCVTQQVSVVSGSINTVILNV